MTDEEREIEGELKGGAVGNRDSRESRAGRSGIAACCPVCRTWFQVDERGLRKHMLRRGHREIDRRGYKVCRNWLESTWGMRLEPAGPSGGLVSPSLGRICQSAISKGIRWLYQMAKNHGQHAHMVIAWNDGDSFGDNYFCCPIGEFFEVMRRIMDDSPEFARRMKQAYEISLKGAGSSPVVVGNGKQGLGPVLDDSSSFRV